MKLREDFKIQFFLCKTWYDLIILFSLKTNFFQIRILGHGEKTVTKTQGVNETVNYHRQLIFLNQFIFSKIKIKRFSCNRHKETSAHTSEIFAV